LSGRDEFLVVAVDGRRGDRGGGTDLPIVGVILPENRAQSESLTDGTDTVIDVAIWRPPAGRGNTGSKLDYLHLVTTVSETVTKAY